MMCIVLLCMYYFLHTLVAGLLTRSQYPEGLATSHLGTGFSWFPCVYKQMLRWFPRLQVATACSSCSPPNFNFLDPYLIFMYMHNNHCHQLTAHLQLNILLLLFQLFSFLVVCSSMISKGFGFVAFFASVETSSVCIHLSRLVCL